MTEKKTERKDKARNRAKVIKAKLKSPLKTEREIAKETKVSKSTVNRISKELGQKGTKDERILWICDKDLEIITLGQKLILEKLWDKKQMARLKPHEISQVIAENTRRYSLFKWNATDSQWGLIQSITIKLDE